MREKVTVFEKLDIGPSCTGCCSTCSTVDDSVPFQTKLSPATLSQKHIVQIGDHFYDIKERLHADYYLDVSMTHNTILSLDGTNYGATLIFAPRPESVKKVGELETKVKVTGLPVHEYEEPFNNVLPSDEAPIIEADPDAVVMPQLPELDLERLPAHSIPRLPAFPLTNEPALEANNQTTQETSNKRDWRLATKVIAPVVLAIFPRQFGQPL